MNFGTWSGGLSDRKLHFEGSALRGDDLGPLELVAGDGFYEREEGSVYIVLVATKKARENPFTVQVATHRHCSCEPIMKPLLLT